MESMNKEVSMNHEKIAELVDREPTPQERVFLEAHPYWARELEAMRLQTEDLSALPILMPPRGDWEHLEGRLRSEGLISEANGRWIRVPALGHPMMRVAAAFLLFLGGAFSGVAFARSAALPTFAAFDVAEVSSLNEAAGLVERAEQQYVSSLHRYRQLAEREGRSADVGLDPNRRAEALGLLVEASRNALRSAPYDPFINGMLVNTLAEQQAVVQQANRKRDDNWF